RGCGGTGAVGWRCGGTGAVSWRFGGEGLARGWAASEQGPSRRLGPKFLRGAGPCQTLRS
ncbi:MAG TPA: hypothetical protein VHE54_00365, partial [Puia sp.]|nr:hypothetical protein [Puia sp.]